jgi:hypothetical protein
VESELIFSSDVEFFSTGFRPSRFQGISFSLWFKKILNLYFDISLANASVFHGRD